MMLLGQNFRGRHQERVIAAFQGAEDCEAGDVSLAGAYVTLQQAAHGMFAGKVGLDLHRNGALRVGKLKADGFKKRLRVGGVAATGQGLGLRLEIISSSTELALKDDKFIQAKRRRAAAASSSSAGKCSDRMASVDQASRRRDMRGFNQS